MIDPNVDPNSSKLSTYADERIAESVWVNDDGR